jgi:ABC-type nickel/cobalt efflux system permease component RcnA
MFLSPRLIFLVFGLSIGGLAVLYMWTGKRRYLRGAWHAFQIGAFVLLLLFGLLALERVF